MILKQYYLGCLAHASYLIADETSKVAAVVDPQRDIDQYLNDAEAAGLTIKHVFLTHFHADFLAGHIEMRDRTGATIHLGGRAEAEYEFAAMKEGDRLDLGPDVRLEAMETPGHTPEGMSILVYNLRESSTEPHAVLTGDTLFIGDVGRPDLLASIGVTAQELAEMLYDSVHNKLVKLPDATLVYPAHGAGSLCGKKLSKETVSTIGEQKKYNYALQPMGRDEFIKLVTADQPDAPDYFVHDAIANRKERPALDASMRGSLRPLDLDAVLTLRDSDAQILDVRDQAEYEGAHLAGSINVGLQGQYATWAGTMLDHKRPIVVIAGKGDESEAIMRLGRIGYDNVAGYLDQGMAALDGRPELIESTPRITAPALAEMIESPDRPVVLDVRSPGEREAGHIEGTEFIPLNQLEKRADELPRDRTIAIHCQGGYRSAIAASLLKKKGFTRLYDLVGGFKAWEASGLPTAGTGAACSSAKTCS
jgi:rhodanese-related sulfurtransferase/glyoxylase-like metal-dependent hydrolase (beta-lactamase superfamily II)